MHLLFLMMETLSCVRVIDTNMNALPPYGEPVGKKVMKSEEDGE